MAALRRRFGSCARREEDNTLINDLIYLLQTPFLNAELWQIFIMAVAAGWLVR